MKKTLLLLVCLAAAWSVAAKIRLPEIIGNDMVLQQNASVKLWGWADPRTNVTVEPSWGGKYTVKSDADGRWSVQLKTPEGSYVPQQIAITGGDRVKLENVLIGEVWFAGGQSNMEMPLEGFSDCPIAGGNETIARAGRLCGKLRYVKVPQTAAYTPQQSVGGKWNDCTPVTAPKFTAAGYYFAELLNDVLDVPVGIIDSSWGGSRVESWTNREILETYPDVDLTEQGIQATTDWLRPMVMYNGMVHPLAGYTVRGFLWYQGETNVNQYKEYADRFARMAALWRDRWGQGELPFYFVEIAPFAYDNGNAAFQREAQCRAQKLIPNSGMISTNDLVEPYEARNIHPKNKQDIGHRLAFMALNRTYGLNGIACEGPQYASVEISDGKAFLTFTHAGEGFNRKSDIRGFEICGPDRVFYPAEAALERGSHRVIVSSEQVAEPVAVRYGFGDFKPGNLANIRELPVVPFRTDDFER